MWSWHRAVLLALEIVLSSRSVIRGRVWVGLSLVLLVLKVLPKPAWNKEFPLSHKRET